MANTAFDSVSSLRPKVAILRSNLFSHRSAAVSYERAFELAAIKPFDFRDLTVAGIKISNALLEGRGLRGVFYGGSTLSQLKALLESLSTRASDT